MGVMRVAVKYGHIKVKYIIYLCLQPNSVQIKQEILVTTVRDCTFVHISSGQKMQVLYTYTQVHLLAQLQHHRRAYRLTYDSSSSSTKQMEYNLCSCVPEYVCRPDTCAHQIQVRHRTCVRGCMHWLVLQFLAAGDESGDSQNSSLQQSCVNADR